MVIENQVSIFNTCLGLMQNEEDANDLAQDTFMEAFKHYSDFRKDSSPKTWLYRIAVNKCLEKIRGKKAKKRSNNSIPIYGSINDFCGSFLHPGVLLENQERAKILFAAIKKLPEDQYMTFTLHKVEGLNQREIAKIIDKSVSSVESLIHRAKMNLRKSLKSYYYETS